MPRPSRSNLGLLVVGLGTVVAPLDTAVNIAFPSITRAFALEVEDIRWVVIAYVLWNLAVGPYRLEAALPGFRTFVQTGIVLQVNASPVINIALGIGLGADR